MFYHRNHHSTSVACEELENFRDEDLVYFVPVRFNENKLMCLMSTSDLSFTTKKIENELGVHTEFILPKKITF